jgi:hypothetical protein
MPVGIVNLAGARPDNLALVSIRGSVQAEWSMVRVCVWSPREERDLLGGGARFRWEGTHERVVIPIRRRSGRRTGRPAQPSLSPPISVSVALFLGCGSCLLLCDRFCTVNVRTNGERSESTKPSPRNRLQVKLDNFLQVNYWPNYSCV